MGEAVSSQISSTDDGIIDTGSEKKVFEVLTESDGKNISEEKLSLDSLNEMKTPLGFPKCTLEEEEEYDPNCSFIDESFESDEDELVEIRKSIIADNYDLSQSISKDSNTLNDIDQSSLDERSVVADAEMASS